MRRAASRAEPTRSARRRRAGPLRIVAACALALTGCREHHEDPSLFVVKPAEGRAHGCAIHADVVPTQKRFVLGQPMAVTFRATTDCAEPLKRIAAKERSIFSVSARDADGDVPEAPDTDDQGGADALVDFGREHPLEQPLVLGEWLRFPAAGRYELTVDARLLVGKTREDVDWVRLTVATPIEITAP